MIYIWIVPRVKTRCSQECMVINYGKLILEEILSAKLKKETIQENTAI